MPPTPTIRHLEIIHIASCGVIFCWGVWRVGLEFVVHVRIDRYAEGLPVAALLQFYVARYVNVIPLLHIESNLIKTYGTRLRVFNHLDFPCPIKTAVVGRCLILQFSNILLVSVGDDIHVWSHLTYAVYPHIIPIILRMSAADKAYQQTE